MKIDFGGSISPFTALIAVFVAVLVTVAISATFTQDASRRNDLFGFTAAGTFALFILLLFGDVTGSEDSRAERQRRQLTIEELLELSNVHVSRNNFERAILFLEEARGRLPSSDTRRKAVDARIDEVKKRQVTLK